MSTGPDDETVETADEADTEIGQAEDLDQTLDAEAVTAPAPPGAVRRALTWCRRHLPVAVTAAVLALSTITAGSVYWFLYRPDRLTNTASQEQVLGEARAATEALLSYSPENIDKNVADAKSRLTGDFLARYTEFADTVVVPAAKQRGVKTEANVARAAVSLMKTDSAQVLVFVNQVTTSRERPTPALATSSVMMTLVRDGDRWLVSEFNPI